MSKNKLPFPGLEPVGLSREEAACHIRVSPSLFDQMVKDGRMPQPKRINSRTVWVRLEVERKFNALPSEEPDEHNPFDDVKV
jgi:predicted DNA-binding transcriptional regulator AlpA